MTQAVHQPQSFEALRQYFIDIALAGLPTLFDEKNQRFHFRARESATGIVIEGDSLRYTLITMLGLIKFRNGGQEVPFDLEAIHESLLKSPGSFLTLGDWSLMLWLTALMGDDDVLDKFYHTYFRSPDMVEFAGEFKDAADRCTMEMAWYLTAMVYTGQKLGWKTPNLSKHIEGIYRLLLENYGGQGVFGHQALSGFKGRLRGNIGTFADQVYPIYALSALSRLQNHGQALEIANSTATKICAVQGDLGQWWWHYHRPGGRAVGGYPVYGVHQDAMAPLALYANEAAAGLSHHEAIYKGMRWIDRENELGTDMVDASRRYVWRNILIPKGKRFATLYRNQFLGGNQLAFGSGLSITKECWSYHLGWILYAFSPVVFQRGASSE
ncbi:MAG TPA: hypothetical protein PKV71_01615 [Calditrichia bacterium]|nr:hypothetical protein [Calditrichia bacterium]HQV30539.1 hypothetical protein [Calditrichia bacterium]